ncbi:MAG: ATP-binding protein [Candidimonas sp.]|nr:ATP-binding protein [Candidimonas sp.]
MTMQTYATLSLVPGPDTVPLALHWLDDVVATLGWPPRTSFKLRLCLDEALTNVVMYGFPQDQAKPGDEIALSILGHDEQRIVEILDNGPAYDPTHNEPADLVDTLSEAKIGGHGLRLMRHFLQDIQYQRIEGRNRLRLIAADEPDPT